MDLQQIAPLLTPSPEGWWNPPSVAAVSYPEEGNSLCFGVEDSSFWFAHRNRCILECMKRLPPPGALFDVGGGNGFVARALQEAGWEVVLVEPGSTGVRNAVQRGIRHVIHATLEDAGVLPESLPAVGLFDVLEHTTDDRTFLDAIHRLLIPGGRIYITVPAYNWLWSDEDIHAGHWRRYTTRSLARALAAAGFQIEFATYFFGFLPPAILLRRTLPYRLGLAQKELTAESMQEDHRAPSSVAGRILNWLTGREAARIIAGRPVRLGGSCLAVGRKAASRN